MEATATHILEQLVKEFSAIEGIDLEPSDKLLLHSFVEEVQAAGGLSTLKTFLMPNPLKSEASFTIGSITSSTFTASSSLTFATLKRYVTHVFPHFSSRKRIKS